MIPTPQNTERFHAIIRGDRSGVGAIIARAGLWCARLPYGVGVWARNRAFDHGWAKSVRMPVPVVCVGNLTLGGTGKTPCVEYTARFYRDLGLQVAVVSRGYGIEAGPNDEAMVLEENLPDVPHLQGADRVATATTAVEELESEVLVLDDGFQHRRLARDLDIVLVDATRPMSQEYLFPRGTLREPVRGLRRAGVIVLTRADQVTGEALEAQRCWLTERVPEVPIAVAVHAPEELLGTEGFSAPTADLAGRKVGVVSGIGNPSAFRRTLTDLDVDVVAERVFPDHHPYTRADVDDLHAWASTLPVDAIVATTQKDFVKLRLPDLAGRSLLALRVGMRFLEGEDVLQDRLRRAVGGSE